MPADLSTPTPEPTTITLEQKRWLFDWMLNEKHLMAAADSPNDRKFQELKKVGLVKCYDAMFGNRYYALTALGKRNMRP